MVMRKRILIVTLILAMLSTSFAFANPGNVGGNTFSDIDSNHWAFENVTTLVAQGGISGFPDGTFRPNNTITIAEFMRIIIGLTVGDFPAFGTEAEPDFHWASGFFDAAQRNDILLPGELNADDRDAPITRQKMALLIARTLENIVGEDITADNPDVIQEQIADFESIGSAYQDAIIDVMSVGIITGFEDGTFRGAATATRAEAATMLARMHNPTLRVDEKFVGALSPRIFTGRSTLQQGEVFAIRLENVPANVRPIAETVLGMSIFTPTGEGEWFVAVPIGNTRQPGTYTVNVTVGDVSWDKEVIVTAYNFTRQYLTLNVQNPAISAANSPEAFAEYRERIPPLFNTYDTEIYWRGTFLRPVEGGRISTPFGAIRITNNNTANPRHHWGIDIATPTGTRIIATNYGRVVLAEYLMHTGNTIVIEHGGGLKSYHFHLNSIYVSYNEMVTRGNLIGTVGSTGSSTGPHLHFEFRIGNQAINPLMLLEATAALYSAE